jgi:uncharacterized integral membrane protein
VNRPAASTVVGGVLLALLLLLVMAFAALNGLERVTLRLGFATFYRFPLTGVAFGAFLAGMIVMFVAGLQSDLRVRRILRERLQLEATGEGATAGSGRSTHGWAAVAPESEPDAEAAAEPRVPAAGDVGAVEGGMEPSGPAAEVDPGAPAPDADPSPEPEPEPEVPRQPDLFVGGGG